MPAHYQAATSAPADLATDDSKETLTIGSIILGMIRESVEPFIKSLDGTWEDSTKFMLQHRSLVVRVSWRVFLQDPMHICRFGVDAMVSGGQFLLTTTGHKLIIQA